MPIPQQFLQDLIARADVVEIVGRHVQLKKTGANYSGLCPFHAEKSPSFTVSPTKQFFHCFGCGKSGNAIGFLMEHTGASFIEAVEDLAQQYGLQVPQQPGSAAERERAAQQREKQATLTSVLEKAGDAYRAHLKQSPRAIDYCKGRGLSGEIARQFGLGYAPEGWRSLAGVFAQYDDPLLAESGLVIVHDDDPDDTKRYDRFRDRLMFPIRNVKGECIGFGGRVLGEEKPKYLNSPETPVFSKGRELYGLFEARGPLRDHGYALVTEGYMDVVALAQWGFANAVATLGTACTAEHVHKLFRFTDAVVFSFDGDAAGRRAARKALDAALPHATDVRSVKFLFLPAEHDPDSYIRERGAEAFAACIADAVPLSRFLLDAAAEGCDTGSAEGRAHLASNARPLWTALPEGALKQQLLAEIARQVQLDAAALAALWAQATGARRPGTAAEASNSYEKDSYPRNTGGRQRPFSSENRPSQPFARRTRAAPPTRADHVARLLLTDMAALQHLPSEDHALLCEQPAPHGALFLWLEGQWHEHGALTWSALRDALRGHEAEPLAVRLMDQVPQVAGAEPLAVEPRERLVELRDLLTRMRIERIEQNEQDALAALATDPGAADRYRALLARRQRLEASLARPPA